jgi:amino acid transporter
MANDQRATLGGKRKLTLIDTIAQSVGLMGPVFSIAFLVPLVVGIISATGQGAGNAASLSVLIAAVGVIGLGWIVAEYTRKIQAAGSLYDYVTDGLGVRVGAAAGWLYYAGWRSERGYCP